MSIALRKAPEGENFSLEREGVATSRRHGRGAQTNRSGRYEPIAYEPVDDGWESLAEIEALTTEVQEVPARRIITKNDSPDIGFDRSINPYRGCEHGCIYCFARPSHAFLGLSPGLDFETKLFAKTNAAEALTRELADPAYRPRMIAIGTNTDPYQPIERGHRVMRRVSISRRRSRVATRWASRTWIRAKCNTCSPTAPTIPSWTPVTTSRFR